MHDDRQLTHNTAACKDWQNTRPRPNFSERALCIAARADGTMELDEWYPLVEQQLEGLGFTARGKVVREIKSMANAQTQLFNVFKATCAESCNNFFKQLVWSLGFHLQKQPRSLLKGQAKLPLMSAKAVDMSEFPGLPKQAGQALGEVRMWV